MGLCLRMPTGRLLPLNDGCQFTAEDLRGLQARSGDVVAVVAVVSIRSRDGSDLSLKNQSQRTWTAYTSEGVERQVAPSNVVALTTGTKIAFGLLTAEVVEAAKPAPPEPPPAAAPPAVSPPPAEADKGLGMRDLARIWSRLSFLQKALVTALLLVLLGDAAMVAAALRPAAATNRPPAIASVKIQSTGDPDLWRVSIHAADPDYDRFHVALESSDPQQVVEQSDDNLWIRNPRGTDLRMVIRAEDEYGQQAWLILETPMAATPRQ